MKGGFHLVCAPDATGRPVLAGRYVSAPMHISKPWWDGDLLIVNAVNSTAGLFSGDEIETRVEVKAGARMLLTSASASRAHRMPAGRASVRQSIDVADGAWLEVWPALFIPHGGSNYFQETRVRLEGAARFLWFETFAPGRVASGEAWEFARFESRFHITSQSRPRRPIARETYSLTPGCASVRALRAQFPAACHGACYAIGEIFTAEVLAGISALHHRECWVGCTRLDAPGIAIRIVAADNVHLTRALTSIRALLHSAYGQKLPALRRV